MDSGLAARAFLASRRNKLSSEDGCLSIFPPHMAWENVQPGAVFGHGASSDRNAALAQDLDDLVIAQWRAAAFVLHQIENGLFDARVAERFAARGLIAAREKIFHLEDPLGCGHIFAGHRAADGGLVHADDLSDFGHGHRFQMRRTVLKEIPLP